MQREYVVLLRAISNVRMEPFRNAMEELAFTDVESFGMSGNLLFNASTTNRASLEQMIADRLGTAAFVRTRSELARIIAFDPFHDDSSSSVLFLARPPSAAQRRTFHEQEYDTEPPILRGKQVYFVYPVRLRGKRSPLDLERALGIQGTARSARVVRHLLARMTRPG